MRPRSPNRAVLAALSVAFLLVLLGQERLYAQEASEYQVKAAFLYNFSKFVEWPGETLDGNTIPMRLCVLNDPSFGQQLSEIVRGKIIKNRPVVVVSVKTGEESRGCQLLFIGSSQSRQTRHVLDALQGTSTLTVGETRDFLKEGGIINFVLQENRVRFQVNHKAATQAGLRISSKLLSLAELVIE